MRQVRSAICLIALACHWPALAAEVPKDGERGPLPQSEQLGFGLEKLRWGMSRREVHSIYPKLKPTPARLDRFPISNLPSMYVSDYSYAGCKFDGVFRFDGGKLRAVEFELTSPAELPAACEKTMKQEFAAKYRTPVTYFKANKTITPDNLWHPFDGWYGDYKGRITLAFFESPNISFGFSDAINKTSAIVYDAAQ